MNHYVLLAAIILVAYWIINAVETSADATVRHFNQALVRHLNSAFNSARFKLVDDGGVTYTPVVEEDEEAEEGSEIDPGLTVEDLFNGLAHGSFEHRRWLLEKLEELTGAVAAYSLVAESLREPPPSPSPGEPA